MSFYFLDTSALVKRYHREPGSEQVNAIFDDQSNVLIISELAIVELASALQRKRNRSEITVRALEFRGLAPVFVCADDTLCQAASNAGLSVLNPETTL